MDESMKERAERMAEKPEDKKFEPDFDRAGKILKEDVEKVHRFVRKAGDHIVYDADGNVVLDERKVKDLSKLQEQIDKLVKVMGKDPVTDDDQFEIDSNARIDQIEMNVLRHLLPRTRLIKVANLQNNPTGAEGEQEELRRLRGEAHVLFLEFVREQVERDKYYQDLVAGDWVKGINVPEYNQTGEAVVEPATASMYAAARGTRDYVGRQEPPAGGGGGEPPRGGEEPPEPPRGRGGPPRDGGTPTPEEGERKKDLVWGERECPNCGNVVTAFSSRCFFCNRDVEDDIEEMKKVKSPKDAFTFKQIFGRTRMGRYSNDIVEIDGELCSMSSLAMEVENLLNYGSNPTFVEDRMRDIYKKADRLRILNPLDKKDYLLTISKIWEASKLMKLDEQGKASRSEARPETEEGEKKDKKSEVTELSSNKEELFLRVREIVREELKKRPGNVVDVATLLSPFGLALGLQQYRIPEGMTGYVEVKDAIEREIELRVRLHNAMLAKSGAGLSGRADSWKAMRDTERWKKTTLRADETGDDYLTIATLESAGGFSVGLMDRSIQWLYSQMGEGSPYIKLGEKGEREVQMKEIKRAMLSALGGDEVKNDALELAWQFWEIHEGFSRADTNNPLNPLVQFKERSRYMILPRFLKDKGRMGFVTNPKGDDIQALGKDGFAMISTGGVPTHTLLESGQLFASIANYGVNGSSYEKMVSGVIAGREVYDLFNKMPAVAAGELMKESFWIDVNPKFGALLKAGIMSKEELETTKRLYFKSLLWMRSPRNEVAKQGRDYHSPEEIRRAYHAAIRLGYLSQESDIRELRDFAKSIWEMIIPVYGVSESEAQRTIASREGGLSWRLFGKRGFDYEGPSAQ